MKMAIALLLALTVAATAQVTTSPTPSRTWEVTVRRDMAKMDSATTATKSQVVYVDRTGDTISLTSHVPSKLPGGKWGTRMEQIHIDASGWEDLLPTLRQALAQNQP